MQEEQAIAMVHAWAAEHIADDVNVIVSAGTWAHTPDTEAVDVTLTVAFTGDTSNVDVAATLDRFREHRPEWMSRYRTDETQPGVGDRISHTISATVTLPHAEPEPGGRS